MTRKLISLFLCAAFAAGSLSLLASCAGGEEDNGPGGEVTSSPSNKVPLEVTFKDLPEEDRIITMAYVEGGNMTLTEHSLVVDEDNMVDGDQVDIAVQKRNQTVESQLGVILEALRVSDDFGALSEMTKDDIMANRGNYDILAGYQYYSIGMAATENGLLLNLNNLGSVGIDGINADYIDLNAPYWGNAYNDAISYKNAYYWITGDIALRYMGGMYCTFVNSKTYEEKILGKDSAILGGAYPNIYDIAREGKWTLDLMMEMSALCYEDIGTTPDAKDAGDKFGFGYEFQDPIDGIAFGSGVQFSWKNPETGDVEITFQSNKSVDFSNKLTTLLKDNASYEYAATDSETVMTNFAAGNIAFTVNKIFMSQVYLMEFNDFYLIPTPKYDENQVNYVTGIHDGVTLFGIPVDCTKVPQTAATLELLAAYSTMYVKPAYYDAALKNRYVRDAAAAEMIDLIHSSVNTDFAAAWSQSIENIVHAYRSLTKLDSTYFVRNKPKWIAALATLTESLNEASGNT